MEDCNALISDCIILSCCCQCLILRLVVFVFFQVPCKVARKLKEYAKRKLIRSKRKKNKKRNDDDDDDNHVENVKRIQRVNDEDYDDDDDDDHVENVKRIQRVNDEDDEFDMCLRILELEGIGVKEVHNWGSCAEEVDKVLGELSLKGEFGFGSFWGRNSETEIRKCNCRGSRSLIKEEDELEFGSHVVKFHFIEVIGPFSSQ